MDIFNGLGKFEVERREYHLIISPPKEGGHYVTSEHGEDMEFVYPIEFVREGYIRRRLKGKFLEVQIDPDSYVGPDEINSTSFFDDGDLSKLVKDRIRKMPEQNRVSLTNGIEVLPGTDKNVKTGFLHFVFKLCKYHEIFRPTVSYTSAEGLNLDYLRARHR